MTQQISKVGGVTVNQPSFSRDEMLNGVITPTKRDGSGSSKEMSLGYYTSTFELSFCFQMETIAIEAKQDEMPNLAVSCKDNAEYYELLSRGKGGFQQNVLVKDIVEQMVQERKAQDAGKPAQPL